MTDSVQVEGVEYISSKRAAEITAYTQDYIGQLARAEKIDARRIGGLWYIRLESLEAYKKDEVRDEEQTDTTAQKVEKAKPSSLVFFDGKEYISAAEGVKATGYHQDYIGQLARGGKIPARQVGARWYISRSDLIEHKRKKDALLWSVQSDSVGLHKGQAQIKDTPKVSEYYSDTRELVPTLSTEKDHYEVVKTLPPEAIEATTESGSVREVENQVPIRVVGTIPTRTQSRVHTKKLAKYRYIAPVMTVVITLTLGLYTFSEDSVLTQNNSRTAENASLSASASSAVSNILSLIESVVSVEKVYIRK